MRASHNGAFCLPGPSFAENNTWITLVVSTQKNSIAFFGSTYSNKLGGLLGGTHILANQMARVMVPKVVASCLEKANGGLSLTITRLFERRTDEGYSS